MKVTKKMKAEMLDILERVYYDVKPALVYNNEFELLIAVILSAQCTDVRVNIVTGRLFAIAPTPQAVTAMGQAALESAIHDCGLYKNKAKNILAACRMLVQEYGGKVPGTYEELLRLPGVGRKTANVVLSLGFGVPAIAVDTHVFRTANRTGLAVGTTPLEVEQGLMKVIAREKWSAAHHWLIWHGRRVCRARAPQCGSCPLGKICPKNIVA